MEKIGEPRQPLLRTTLRPAPGHNTGNTYGGHHRGIRRGPPGNTQGNLPGYPKGHHGITPGNLPGDPLGTSCDPTGTPRKQPPRTTAGEPPLRPPLGHHGNSPWGHVRNRPSETLLRKTTWEPTCGKPLGGPHFGTHLMEPHRGTTLVDPSSRDPSWKPVLGNRTEGPQREGVAADLSSGPLSRKKLGYSLGEHPLGRTPIGKPPWVTPLRES
jgi:hypothetical protein